MASSATDSQGKDKNIREKLIETGHIDVIISVANNFFYTKSLPCSLWFFDKGKNEKYKNKVLFIDARNYYTAVDRNLNEWSDWQIKNLNAIVWLYRGETDKYKALLSDYRKELGSDLPFGEIKKQLAKEIEKIQAQAKEAVENAKRNEKKKVRAEFDEKISEISAKHNIAEEGEWLYDKFGEGEYCDVLGLCKAEDKEIILGEKGCSLTPGAYVGVAPVEDDGVDFAERMKEIHRELLDLQAESNTLMETISKNLEEMGL